MSQASLGIASQRKDKIALDFVRFSFLTLLSQANGSPDITRTHDENGKPDKVHQLAQWMRCCPSLKLRVTFGSDQLRNLRRQMRKGF